MNSKKLVAGFGIGIIIGSMLFYIAKNYYDYYNFKKQTHQDIAYWKAVAGEYPNYPDCWVELAVNWHNLGKDKFAILAIEKAQRLDPINSNIKEIKERLR